MHFHVKCIFMNYLSGSRSFTKVPGLWAYLPSTTDVLFTSAPFCLSQLLSISISLVLMEHTERSVPCPTQAVVEDNNLLLQSVSDTTPFAAAVEVHWNWWLCDQSLVASFAGFIVLIFL